ncbi:fibronectin type III domain-containing protein, partial [Nocardioides sp.]|uniref:fibronectin type III domain-containing protein n=1 Tax=Nocardioides sp. TaxID=35761 RepID=UPI002EDB8FA5
PPGQSGAPDPTGSPSTGSGTGRGPGPDSPSVDPNAPHPLQPPRGVTAFELPSGSVQVTWQHPGDPADSFTVQEPDGPVLVEVSGAARQASVSVAPGTHRFTVTAFRAGEPFETSAPSNAVTTSGRPSGVTGVVGRVSGNPDDTTATIDVQWTAAQDNGSPVLTYTVVMTNAYGTETHEVPTTSTSFVATCPTVYCNPSPVTVRVTATNAKGAGPTVTETIPYDGPEPPALPAGGAQLVDRSEHTWTGRSWMGHGTTRLMLSPPDDWRGFTGTCSWTHTGNRDGEDQGELPCDATSLTVDIETGVIRGADSGVRQHRIVFTASNGTESVSSAVYTWLTKQEVMCPRCS